jgi:hypothetical protein
MKNSGIRSGKTETIAIIIFLQLELPCMVKRKTIIRSLNNNRNWKHRPRTWQKTNFVSFKSGKSTS